MQIETYIIVAGLLASWIATAFYVARALKKAYARGVSNTVKGLNELHSQEVEGLRQDLQHQIALRTAEQVRSEPPCTLADHLLLTNVNTTLRLAVETWQAFPGTETMVAKATQQQRALTALAAKIWVSGYPTQSVAEDAA